MIGRREFVAGIGSAAAWSVVARAQQGERVRRIGVLLPWDENEPRSKTSVSAFTQALAGLGWTDGRKWSLAAEGLQLGEGSRRRFTVGILFRTS